MLNSLIGLAIRHRWIRRLLEVMRIRELANFSLRHRPRQGSLKGGEIVYRMRSLDSLLVAREVFAQQAYGDGKNVASVNTFADLGSNCGYFGCWLAAHSNAPQNLRGLMLEANPEMVEESEWHLKKNGLTGINVCWGLVGADSTKKTETFYVHPGAAGSSLFAKSPEAYVTHNQWKPVEVPVLSLSEEWEKRWGTTPCDLLKIDIEGAELSFLEGELSFLHKVGLLLIEIHHWIIDTKRLEKLLEETGFELVKILSSDENADVRLYRNKAAVPRQ